MQYGAACTGNAIDFLWSLEPGVTQADAPRFGDARICRHARAARSHAVENMHAAAATPSSQCCRRNMTCDAATAAAADTASVTAAAAAVERQNAGERPRQPETGASLSPMPSVCLPATYQSSASTERSRL